MTIMMGFLTVIHVIVALLLIGIVLMQKSQDQGVGAAFGGGMTESVFGAGTTTALVRITIWCACIMLGTTLLLAILHSRSSSETSGTVTQKVLQGGPAIPAQLPAIPSVLPAPKPEPVPAPAPAAPATKP